MASWLDLLLGLFRRDDIVGPELEEDSPTASYYSQRMQLGSQRIKLYKDYADMGMDTIISGVLDIYADECAQFDRIQGSSIWSYSKNKQVQSSVSEMLENIEAENQVYGITRYLAQYGDNFIHPLFSREKGIASIEHMDAEEIDRKTDKYNQLVGFGYKGAQQLLDPYTFVHFRIMSRTQSAKHGGGIYGTSMLSNARKTWRQLVMMEDAMVIYRLDIGTRHKVFYIDVGEADYVKAIQIAKMYKREFGKRTYQNPNSGEWNSRYNPLNPSADMFWPVRKGSESRIDYLGSDPSVSAIVDLEYMRDRLFAALKVPKAYLGAEDLSSTRYSLSQIDITFSKFVSRLQRAVRQGFYRLGQIHLALQQGPEFVLDRRNDFEIVMSTISTLDQEQRLQAMDLSLSLAQKLHDLGSMLGIEDGVLSLYICKHLLGLNSVDMRMLGYEFPDANTNPAGSMGRPGTLVDSLNELEDNSKMKSAMFDQIVKVLQGDATAARIVDEVRRGTENTPLKVLPESRTNKSVPDSERFTELDEYLAVDEEDDE